MSGITSQSLPLLIPRLPWSSIWRPLLVTLPAALLTTVAYLAVTRHARRPPPTFKRLTFRSGTIVNARFGPDGQTIYYGAKWAGNPVNVFAVRPDSPESRDLGFGQADVLAISSGGQIALSLRRHPIGYARAS